MTTVSFKGVGKTFANGTCALVNFGLHVRDGELLVLVGPSGCGKSTALRLLAGLETVTRGEICIGDEVVNDMTPQQRNIAMVFQNYALYPHMSVRRNLAFPLRMQKLSATEKQKRVAWAAELLQLSELLDRMPRQLSGGQRQRVAMGRAIVREPRVFLMDEPLSNLDAKMRLQIRGEIAALQRRLNITTLYVTHDQVEAMTLGDRVAVMSEGVLQQVDIPRHLYARPANTFVAGFIGSPGMNLIPGRLRQTTAGLQVGICGDWFDVAEQGRARPESLSLHIGQPLSLGLRPEALIPADTGEAMLQFRLEATEQLGHEQLLYFAGTGTSRQQLVARCVQPTEFNTGMTMSLRFDPAELYYFDSKGVAIYS